MREETFQTDIAVIGAGVIGLACARALAMQGHEVMVLEAEPLIASHTSSRNSEVIHAGLYYAAGSLKARHCVIGRRQLVTYLAERGITHDDCGKLVIAINDAEADRLAQLKQRAEDNGVEGLRVIDGPAARAIEPALAPTITGALQSDVSGIFDSHAYFLSLQGDLEDHGGIVALNAPVLRGETGGSGVTLHVGGDMPARLSARWVINAAGHSAVDIARAIEGPHTDNLPTPRFVKGSYFSLTGKPPFSRLIYPMPGTASLGLHYTRDLGGRGKFGPDAQWLPEGATPPFDYTVAPDRADEFYAAIRSYWPGLPDGALAPDYSGVRPKLVNENEPSGDFQITGPAQHGTPGLINLLGMESPGLTSSLSIGAQIAEMVK